MERLDTALQLLALPCLVAGPRRERPLRQYPAPNQRSRAAVPRRLAVDSHERDAIALNIIDAQSSSVSNSGLVPVAEEDPVIDRRPRQVDAGEHGPDDHADPKCGPFRGLVPSREQLLAEHDDG